MKPLDKTLRNKLERTAKEARCIAEAAARAVVEQLGVGESAPFSHLSDRDRELRRKLRAHGRQLGDVRDSKQGQELDRLIEEVAYEHWHRMLFARFLAENKLLMYPDPDDPVAVTLEECGDLAADEGAKNGWELASRFAARMLPQIFRPDSPVFQLGLPPEHQQKLERMLAELPLEVFTASDSLGWVYQFWQAKKKDEINASEVKIGARELPVVTQLFTEPYMVSFLLDNSLGAWWAARRLTETDFRRAKTEEELREKVSLPGMPLEYLRFVKNDNGTWTPAAGIFENWPDSLVDFRVLDPCCGSGHFLVSALLTLVPMRMELEGISARDAVDSVLRDNLHGLEIDQRCVELAAFAVALTAWRYPGTGGYRKFPELNLACTGLSVGVGKEEWTRLALDKHNLRIALDWMYDMFKDAPVLGSLLNPVKSNATKIVSWNELSKAIANALDTQNGDHERHEASVVAHGLTKAAPLLSGKYDLITTNVPYLTRGRQGDILRQFCENNHSVAKNELATVFLDRCLDFCETRNSRSTPKNRIGTVCIVLPQNWLFQPTYKKFREKLLKNHEWNFIIRLGPGAFETISGEVVKAILFSLRHGRRLNTSDRQQTFSGIDVSGLLTPYEKAEQLKMGEMRSVGQEGQLRNPDAAVTLENIESEGLLSQFARAWQGLVTGDDNRYHCLFWEVLPRGDTWTYIQQAPSITDLFCARSHCIRWEKGNGALHKSKTAHNFPPKITVGKPGVAIQRMSSLNVTIYTGEVFDDSVAPLIPKDNGIIPAILAYCQSDSYRREVRRIDQAVKVVPGSLTKVPFDLSFWQKVAAEKYLHGLPKPYSDDPTQWVFHGHPAISTQPLQVVLARLLGYRWPAELDNEMELSDEARGWIKKTEALLSYVDPDGIVCIPPARGEASATDRLLNMLAVTFGESWSGDKLSELLNLAGHAGKTLDSWLRDKFFTQHCALFHHRPFIWHIWDGLRDGFAALINYHKLDRKNLENLIYSYLGDWINRQKQDQVNGVDGAGEKLAAAENLKKRLEFILEGEAPYDIFVRWKPLDKQPIGWDPDINDGVRVNIRPFLTVPDVGKRGAGVLRDKPNINWNKDRGKDVPSSPWYILGPKYGGNKGDRINDHHLTLAEKFDARAGKGG